VTTRFKAGKPVYQEKDTNFDEKMDCFSTLTQKDSPEVERIPPCRPYRQVRLFQNGVH